VVGADEDAHGGESVRLPGWRCWVSTGGAAPGSGPAWTGVRSSCWTCAGWPTSSPCRTSRWSASTCRSACRRTACGPATSMRGTAPPYGAASSVSPPRCARVLGDRRVREPGDCPGGDQSLAGAIRAGVPVVKAIRALDDGPRRPAHGSVGRMHPELAFRGPRKAGSATPRPPHAAWRSGWRLRGVMDVVAALLAAPPRGPAVDALEPAPLRGGPADREAPRSASATARPTPAAARCGSAGEAHSGTGEGSRSAPGVIDGEWGGHADAGPPPMITPRAKGGASQVTRRTTGSGSTRSSPATGRQRPLGHARRAPARARSRRSGLVRRGVPVDG
jgi:hypothetical protein